VDAEGTRLQFEKSFIHIGYGILLARAYAALSERRIVLTFSLSNFVTGICLILFSSKSEKFLRVCVCARLIVRLFALSFSLQIAFSFVFQMFVSHFIVCAWLLFPVEPARSAKVHKLQLLSCQCQF